MPTKIDKARKKALKEAAKRGKRIWRELSESTTPPAPKVSKVERQLAKEVRKTVRQAVRADFAALTEAAITRGKAEVTRQVLAEMDPGQFRRHAANEWDRHFEQMAAPLVPDVWKRGSLSDNQSQQSPAA